MGGRLLSVAFALAMGATALACATAGGGPGAGEAPDATAARDAGGGAGADAAVEPAAEADADANAQDAAPNPDATLGDEQDGGDEAGESPDGGSVTESDASNDDFPRDAATPIDARDESAPPPMDAAPDEGAAPVDAGPTSDAAPIVDAATDAPSSCGCTPGFACGSSGYCKTSTGVPEFDHVFVIVLDDQPLSAVMGNTLAPYLNKLMATYAYGTAYTTTFHPSLPNLIDLTSGNPQQIACDCSPGAPNAANTCNALNCNALGASCACPIAVSHLGDELDVAKIPWREYAESMGAPCNPNGVDGGAVFAANHVPFLYYVDIYGNNGRCVERVRDYTDFAADLASGAYRFSLVSPNLCNDMHGGCGADPVKQGDQWLAAQVPAILATPGFAASGRDVLFIVGDEPDAFGNAPVPFVVVSPLAKQGPTAGAYTHESLLTTIEDGLGVSRLGNTAGAATIADVWR